MNFKAHLSSENLDEDCQPAFFNLTTYRLEGVHSLNQVFMLQIHENYLKYYEKNKGNLLHIIEKARSRVGCSSVWSVSFKLEIPARIFWALFLPSDFSGWFKKNRYLQESWGLVCLPSNSVFCSHRSSQGSEFHSEQCSS